MSNNPEAYASVATHRRTPVPEQGPEQSDLIIERSDFAIRLADTEHGRNSASMLINKMYSWRGYGAAHRIQGSPSKITLTAATKQNEVIGTLTLCIDGNGGLAAERLFKDEIEAVRRRGGKPCEFTKLAINLGAHSQGHFASLCHVAFIYAYSLHKCTDLFIEVNPRHRRFYEAMLDFTCCSDLRMNADVNAPAYLMWLDLSETAKTIARHHSLEGAGGRRSLYKLFFSPSESDGILRRLRALG